ncbi:MAG: hypothetical protein JWP97_3591 [Labilithrix sp.]|nr:hypothetical protein [Labilithrix sp.]
MKSRPPSGMTVTVVASLQLAAIGMWASGLVVLGAIVAPIVFSVVPAPGSADAMTQVFRRFDLVAIACAVIALAAEAFLARGSGRISKPALARVMYLTTAAGLAIAVATWLSPRIAALHQGGAIRGVGADGLALERLHRMAENFGKLEAAVLAAALFYCVQRLAAPPPPPP